MNRYDSIWVDRYNIFVRFLKANKRVPKTTEKWEDVFIGSWYHNQIASHKRGDLASNRLRILNNLYPSWYDCKSFNKYLASVSWKSKVKVGETRIDTLLSGSDLEKAISRNIYTVEELYRVGVRVRTVPSSLTSLAFKHMFPYMEFYEAKMISDMFRDKEFLELDNLKSILTEEIQKGYHEEIEFGMSNLVGKKCTVGKKYTVLKEKYINGKSNEEISKIVGVSVSRVHQLLIGGLRGIKNSKRLKNIYFNQDVSVVLPSSKSFSCVMKFLKSEKDKIAVCSEEDYIRNVQPLLKGLFIENLGLSQRSKNCLLRGGISSLDCLLSYSREDLLKIRNLGKGCTEEVVLGVLNPVKEILFKNEKILNLYTKEGYVGSL